MITTGVPSPDFALEDQFGRVFRLSDYRGRRSVLLLFYPLDNTPTCSSEVPVLDQLAGRCLREANTLPVAVSVNDRHCHAVWGDRLGGVAIPILADFEPKGLVAAAFGAYVPARGVTDRATVIVNVDGVVAYAQSVGVEGRRDIPELLAIATRLAQPGEHATPARGPLGTPVLYVRDGCFFCDRAIMAVHNLHLTAEQLVVKNVDRDRQARVELFALGPPAAAPTLAYVDATGTRRVARGMDPVTQALAAFYAPR